MTDGAAEFRAMCLEHCAACRRAGIPEPTPDEWADRMEEVLRDAAAEGDEPD